MDVCDPGCGIGTSDGAGLFQFALAWIVGSLSLPLFIDFSGSSWYSFVGAQKAFWGRISDVALIVAFIGIYRSFGVQDFASFSLLGSSRLGYKLKLDRGFVDSQCADPVAQCLNGSPTRWARRLRCPPLCVRV